MTAWVILGSMGAAIGCTAFVMLSLTTLSIAFNALCAALDNLPTLAALAVVALVAARLTPVLWRAFKNRPCPYEI